MPTDESLLPPRPESVWPWLLVCAATAFFIDLGTYHRHHHGDSLIPVMISLQEWTPYSWEQNRLGSLMPLIALPFRHPLDNLLVQHFACITLSLAAFFLLPRYAFRERGWSIAGVVGASLFLAFTPEFYRSENLNPQMPWWNSLALGVGGLLLTESPRAARRVVPGIFLLALSCWLNTGMPVALGILVAARTWVEAGRSANGFRARLRKAWTELDLRQVAILGGVFGAGASASMTFSPIRDTGMNPMWPHLWPSSWAKLAATTWGDLTRDATVPWPVVLPTGAVLGTLWLLTWPGGAARGPVLRAAAVLGITGVVSGLAIGSTEWVRQNEWSSRYALVPVMLMQASLCLLLVGPLLVGTSGRLRTLVSRAGMVAVPGVALGMYGPPSISGVKADLDRTLGTMTADILSAECTHVLGNFWDVWPAVYHANLTLAERGEARVVWGIAHRAEPARRHWGHLPVESFRFATARVSVWKDDLDWIGTSVEHYLRPPEGSLELREERPTIRVLYWKPTRRDD